MKRATPPNPTLLPKRRAARRLLQVVFAFAAQISR
jgi:hypothetical protein